MRNLDVVGGMAFFVFAAGVVPAAGAPGFLRGDGDAFLDVFGVVRADFAADSVFERGDDFAAGCVVLGVRAEDDGYVERKADGVALNLDVAFLHDVEESDLDLASEVG